VGTFANPIAAVAEVEEAAADEVVIHNAADTIVTTGAVQRDRKRRTSWI